MYVGLFLFVRDGKHYVSSEHIIITRRRLDAFHSQVMTALLRMKSSDLIGVVCHVMSQSNLKYGFINVWLRTPGLAGLRLLIETLMLYRRLIIESISSLTEYRVFNLLAISHH